MSRGLPTYWVDAFVGPGLRGNPAAVCLLDEPMPERSHLAISSEMGLPETAFVRRVRDGSYALPWFTPRVEVPLCGHATLASAHVLYQERGLAGPTLLFDTHPVGSARAGPTPASFSSSRAKTPSPRAFPGICSMRWGSGKRATYDAVLAPPSSWSSSRARKRSPPSTRTSDASSGASRTARSRGSSLPPLADLRSTSSPASSIRGPGFLRTRSPDPPTPSSRRTGPSVPDAPG